MKRTVTKERSTSGQEATLISFNFCFSAVRLPHDVIRQFYLIRNPGILIQRHFQDDSVLHHDYRSKYKNHRLFLFISILLERSLIQKRGMTPLEMKRSSSCSERISYSMRRWKTERSEAMPKNIPQLFPIKKR